MFEYISPCFEVQIGGTVYRNIENFNVYSSRINPIDHSEINIDITGIPVNAIQKDQPVEIWHGYREHGLWQIFSGKVADTSYKRVISVYCKDTMEQLRSKTITKSFVNVQPQEIIKFVLLAAGITKFTISAKNLPPKHSFIVAGKNGVEVIKLVNRSWDLNDWCFYCEPDGEFYWGPWEESKRYLQQEIITLEYGKNILDLKPSDEETGTLKTIALPFLRHSELIKIKDSRYWSQEVTARIERIQYQHGIQVRTFIEWRILKNL